MIIIGGGNERLLKRINRLFRMRAGLNYWEKRTQLLRKQLSEEIEALPEPMREAIRPAIQELYLKGTTHLEEFDLSADTEQHILDALTTICQLNADKAKPG